MKRGLACLAVAVPFLVSVPSAAADGGDGWGSQTSAKAGSDGSTFHATSTAFVDPDGTTHRVESSGGHAASPYEYKVRRFAGICNNDALGQPQDLVFVDRRLVAAGPNAPWEPASAFCASPNAQPLDLGDIAAQAATVTESIQPPRPTVRAQPGGTTLVGNPTVFSGGELADMTPPALVNPLSGRALQLRVRPTTWTWDFNDGSAPVTTQGPPPPYTGGSTDGLLTHTYKHPGDVSVTVTVSWAASYTISGVAGVQNVANNVASTATIPLRVREARSQLVSH
jgi:hypothetical protein